MLVYAGVQTVVPEVNWHTPSAGRLPSAKIVTLARGYRFVP